MSKTYLASSPFQSLKEKRLNSKKQKEQKNKSIQQIKN
jgi:hypothetical protein